MLFRSQAFLRSNGVELDNIPWYGRFHHQYGFLNLSLMDQIAVGNEGLGSSKPNADGLYEIADIGNGLSFTVMHRLHFGLLSAGKLLPVKYAPLEIELSMINSPADWLLTDSGASTNFQLENISILYDGYTLDEARGKTPDALLQGAETDRECAAKVLRNVRAGFGVRDVEMLHYAKSGQAYWVLLEMQPVRDALGNVVQYVHVEIDITARKRAEQEALRLNAELQASIAELEELNRQTRVVGALRDALQRCETLADIYAAACLHARSLIPGSSGALYAQAAGSKMDNLYLRQAAWGEARERAASLDADKIGRAHV